jgi:hypothetical protein
MTRRHAMSRPTIAAVLTALLLSVGVGVAPAPAGEWSPEYRAVLARTVAKRREYRARYSWIRPINDAVSAYVFQEVTYPGLLQQQLAWQEQMAWWSAAGFGGGGSSSGGGSRSRDRDDDK